MSLSYSIFAVVRDRVSEVQYVRDRTVFRGSSNSSRLELILRLATVAFVLSFESTCLQCEVEGKLGFLMEEEQTTDGYRQRLPRLRSGTRSIRSADGRCAIPSSASASAASSSAAFGVLVQDGLVCARQNARNICGGRGGEKADVARLA